MNDSTPRGLEEVDAELSALWEKFGKGGMVPEAKLADKILCLLAEEAELLGLYTPAEESG